MGSFPNYKLICQYLKCHDCPLACEITCQFVREILIYINGGGRHISLLKSIVFGVVRGQFIECIFYVPNNQENTDLRNNILNFYNKSKYGRWYYHDNQKIILRSIGFDRRNYDTTWVYK